jgi:hypothetical protein
MDIEEKKKTSSPFIINPPVTPLLLNRIFHVKYFFFTRAFLVLRSMLRNEPGMKD